MFFYRNQQLKNKLGRFQLICFISLVTVDGIRKTTQTLTVNRTSMCVSLYLTFLYTMKWNEKENVVVIASTTSTYYDQRWRFESLLTLRLLTDIFGSFTRPLPQGEGAGCLARPTIHLRAPLRPGKGSMPIICPASWTVSIKSWAYHPLFVVR